MTALDQPRTSFTETLLHRRVVANRVSLIDPLEHPFLTWAGLDSARDKFMISETGKQIEWVIDQYRQLTGTLSATAAADGTALTVSDASVFKKYDIILMPDGTDKAIVTAVDTTGNALTVTRDFDGATGATQATGTITVLSEAQLENRSAWTVGSQESMSTAVNYIQTFEDSVKLTDVEMKIARHAIPDMFSYQVDKKMPELMRQIERAIFYQTTGSAGSATAPSYMKGLRGFITSNSFQTTRAALTFANIQSLMLSTFNNGGYPDTVWANPDFLTYLTALYNNSQFLRVETAEDTLGMDVRNLKTSFGSFKLMLDRNISTADVWFLDSKMIGLYEFMAFATEDLPRSSPHEQKSLNGTYTLAVGAQKAHARLNFSA